MHERPAKLGLMFEEPKASPSDLALPLRLGDGSPAVVREVSAHGMYLEIEGERTLAGPLVLDLHPLGARVKFTAHCEVVRTVRVGTKTGIFLRFVASNLRPLE